MATQFSIQDHKPWKINFLAIWGGQELSILGRDAPQSDSRAVCRHHQCQASDLTKPKWKTKKYEIQASVCSLSNPYRGKTR
jgi:hypothetical protein